METDFSRHGILPYFFPSTTPTARRPFQSKFKIINIYFFMIIWSNLRLNTFANSMLSHHHPKQYHCSHIHPKHHETGHIHLEPEHVLRKRAVSVNLRIKVHYDQSVHLLSPEKFGVINNTVLPDAISYWENSLMVRPLNVPIRLSRKCANSHAYFHQTGAGHRHQYCKRSCRLVTTCGEVIVPAEHLDVCRVCDERGKSCSVDSNTTAGDGIRNADFIFYVSALQTDRCNKSHSSTVAYAAHCQQESGLDRPIAGHANLCPDSISTHPQDLDTLLSTVRHEMAHALGFSVSLYAYFRDPEGNPLTERNSNGRPTKLHKSLSTHLWSDRVIANFTRNNWAVRGGRITKQISMVVTPRVVEETRKHFNCDTLEGAELEDQGEEGTLLTHWEKRVFEHEAMTGTHTQNPVYSRITFALLEDTGWYIPNYAMAQLLKWGRNLGCEFAKRSCKDWMDSRRKRNESVHPFCEKIKRDPLETECTDSRDALALCNLMEYKSPLLPEYQNFDRLNDVSPSQLSHFGGSVVLADYCPYIQEFTWKYNEQALRGSQCQYEQNSPTPDKNFALEYYGPGAKCFNHGRRMWEERSCQQVRQWQHWGSACYQYECKDGRLHLVVANHTYTCYYRNQELRIQTYAYDWLHIGSIICPPCKEVCAENGMRCKPDVIKGSLLMEKSYHKDTLPCSAISISTPMSVILILFVQLCLHTLQRQPNFFIYTWGI